MNELKDTVAETKAVSLNKYEYDYIWRGLYVITPTVAVIGTKELGGFFCFLYSSAKMGGKLSLKSLLKKE